MGINPARSELCRLFVLPDFWATPVADVLHDHALVELCYAGCTEAVLDVLTHNQRARAYYARHHWAQTDEQTYDDAGTATTELQRWRRSLL